MQNPLNETVCEEHIAEYLANSPLSTLPSTRERTMHFRWFDGSLQQVHE